MQQPTVLVIDDSPTICQLVMIALQRHGIRVEMATNPTQGLDLVPLVQPDLIFVGERVAGANGRRLCRAIRKHEAHQTTPIVLLVNNGGAQAGLQCWLANANTYLDKPFDIVDITNVVYAQLGYNDPQRSVSVRPSLLTAAHDRQLARV